MADVVCLGEALVDLVPTQTGLDLAKAETFLKAAGGAPANVAVGLARLGVSAAFLGTVGSDAFGDFLAETLAANGVDVSGLHRTTAAPTALAAVSLAANGDRDFIFYGDPAAHMMLAPDDIDQGLLGRARTLHFGSISLIAEPARAATWRAVDLATERGLHVSFDPNLRLPLWPDADAARIAMRLGLSRAIIVKIAAEEVTFLTGKTDLVEGARALWHSRLSLMAVTRGAAGCLWLTATLQGAQPGFAVEAVDTTGAGDAFTAALLAGLAAIDFDQPEDRLERHIADMIRFANAAGALTTTRRGAIPALPSRAEILNFLHEQRNPFAINPMKTG